LFNLTRSTTGAVVTNDDKELTPAQVAKEFQVSPSMVRRWGQKGWLPPTRRLIGSGYRRYSRVDVERFRKRMEAGEFDGVADVAANRRRTGDHDAPSGGAAPFVSGGAAVDPPSGAEAHHRNGIDSSLTVHPQNPPQPAE